MSLIHQSLILFSFLKEVHAVRDPEFQTDPLVKKFLLSVSRVAAHIHATLIPRVWSLWFNPKEATRAKTEVGIAIPSSALISHFFIYSRGLLGSIPGTPFLIANGILFKKWQIPCTSLWKSLATSTFPLSPPRSRRSALMFVSTLSILLNLFIVL